MRTVIRALLPLTLLACVGLALYAGGPRLLPALGTVLVEDDQRTDVSDAILVLAGDEKGERIMRACELVKSGRAPVVLVSGPHSIYGHNEADLAIAYAVSRGCPAEAFQACKFVATSTVEEAHAFAPELRRRGIRKLDIVTSNYHTARAGRIFRRTLGDDVRVRMISASDRLFDPENWWRQREGRKTWLLEMTKTVTSMVGM